MTSEPEFSLMDLYTLRSVVQARRDLYLDLVAPLPPEIRQAVLEKTSLCDLHAKIERAMAARVEVIPSE